MLSIHTVAVVRTVAVRTVSLYTLVCTRDALNTHRGRGYKDCTFVHSSSYKGSTLSTHTHHGCGCTDCEFAHSCSYKGCSQHTPWLWLYGLYVCALLFVLGMLSTHTVAVAVRTVRLCTPVRIRDALNTHRGCSCTDCTLVHSCSY